MYLYAFDTFTKSAFTLLHYKFNIKDNCLTGLKVGNYPSFTRNNCKLHPTKSSPFKKKQNTGSETHYR